MTLTAWGKLKQDVTRETKRLSAEEEKDLALKAKQGDPRARDTLIMSMAPLAMSMAIKFSNNQRKDGILDKQELVSQALIELVKAVDRFRPELDYRLITYVHMRLRFRLARYVRNAMKPIKVPPISAIKAVKLPKGYKTSEEWYEELENRQFTPIDTENGVNPKEQFSDLEEAIDYEHTHTILMQLLKHIKPQYRDIVLRRLKGETLEAIGNRQDRSRQAIRQAYERTLNKMRTLAKSLRLEY